MLNCSGVGGYIGTSFIKHLWYADDLCLISLSSSGMQHLLNICNEYATTHKLLYNGSKSFSLCFKKNALRVSAPSFYLDNFYTKLWYRFKKADEKIVCYCKLIVRKIF